MVCGFQVQHRQTVAKRRHLFPFLLERVGDVLRLDGSFTFYSNVFCVTNLNDIKHFFIAFDIVTMVICTLPYFFYSSDCLTALMMLIQFLCIVWKLSLKDKHDNFLVFLFLIAFFSLVGGIKKATRKKIFTALFLNWFHVNALLLFLGEKTTRCLGVEEIAFDFQKIFSGVWVTFWFKIFIQEETFSEIFKVIVKNCFEHRRFGISLGKKMTLNQFTNKFLCQSNLGDCHSFDLKGEQWNKLVKKVHEETLDKFRAFHFLYVLLFVYKIIPSVFVCQQLAVN